MDFFDDFDRSLMKESKLNIRTDVIDKGDHYLLESELPGFDKDNIQIQLEGDYLTIHAQRQSHKEEKDEAGNYVHRERQFGSFSRSFGIDGIDTENIEADFDKGLLKIKLPKKKEEKKDHRQIDIN